jgi:hypothetical protein
MLGAATLDHIGERGPFKEYSAGTGAGPVQDLAGPLTLVRVELQPIVRRPMGMGMSEKWNEQDTQGGGKDDPCYHGRGKIITERNSQGGGLRPVQVGRIT